MVKYIVLFVIVSAVFINAEDYCKYKCGSQENIGCIKPSVPETCQDYKDVEMTDALKQKLVDKHNEKREIVRSGQGRIKNNELAPPASNMLNMTWDDELAFLAAYNVRSCKMKHDCASTSRGYSGQNLFAYSTTGTINVDNVVPQSVEAWYAENKFTRLEDLKKLTTVYVDGKAIGHYTQVIWAKTDKVGCAASTYRTGKWKNMIVACNYFEGGNLIGAPVYQFA